MTAHVFTVSPEALYPEVVRLMRDKQIRHVPVQDADTRLLGLISERDVLRSYQIPKGDARLTVSGLRSKTHSVAHKVMDAHTTTVSGTTSLHDAAIEMLRNHVDCLPVVKDGHLIEIITDTDFIRLIIRS